MTSARVRAGARGLAGAMAMTGMRQVTSNLGLVDTAPPEAMVGKAAPDRLRRLRPRTRTAVTELAHWTYGAVGGVGYGLLPARARRQPLSRPLYGLAVWLSFEAGIAPLLGLGAPHGKVVGRIAVMADHVLYGVVVGGRLAPDPEAR